MALEVTFEIDRTVDAIKTGGFRKIALQFPDELLSSSAQVASILMKRFQDTSLPDEDRPRFYLLADTTYGSCCVDEVAALHVEADLVVHYGRSCLSRTSRIPVLHVFTKTPIDIDDAIDSIKGILPTSERCLIFFDTTYHHAISKLASALKDAGFQDIVPSEIQTDDLSLGSRSEETVTASQDQGVLTLPLELPLGASSNRRKFWIPDGSTLMDYTILFIGGESLTLTDVLMTYSKHKVVSYDPVARMAREESAKVNRMLMRRYALVQKAKDADVFGIVVGTLGVVSYLPMIDSLKRLITSRGKRPYLIAVGKPNPAKLGNFLEVDVFVLVACPENSLVDSKEFLRPIITPFELQMALSHGREWDGSYVTDLARLAPTISQDAENEKQRALELGDDADEPYFSLASGGLKGSSTQYGDHASTADGEEAVDGQAVALRQSGTMATAFVSSAAADYLNTRRTFRGLEIGGDSEAAEIVEGRSALLTLASSVLFFIATACAGRSIEGRLAPGDVMNDLNALSSNAKVYLDGGSRVAFVEDDGSFTFDDVSPGSHLLEVIHKGYMFDKVRVMITSEGTTASIHVDGTSWATVGPPLQYPLILPAKASFSKHYFVPREGFNIWSIFANPMMLMMGGTLLMFFLLPKMAGGLDPELVKDIQEKQKEQKKAVESLDISQNLANFFAPAPPSAKK
ncbi:Diphthamide biosynthesis protein 2 [Blyttiomyces sp. JEL0837]|nr:Diphthamide biosynthesis protein 2 [Blyttiomyces sp. JEL0837]